VAIKLAINLRFLAVVKHLTLFQITAIILFKTSLLTARGVATGQYTRGRDRQYGCKNPVSETINVMARPSYFQREMRRSFNFGYPMQVINMRKSVLNKCGVIECGTGLVKVKLYKLGIKYEQF